MRVVLLLAGQSKRFWPLSQKALFPLLGKTLLEHQVGRLKKAGLTDIVFVGSAENLATVRALFPKAHAVEQDDLSLGMQGALLSALPSCKKEPVLIVSSNDVVEPGAYKTVAAALKKGVTGALLAKEVTSYFPGGYLTVDKQHRIAGIVEKPGEGHEPSKLVNLVVHAFRDASVLLSALRDTKPGTRDDAYERTLDGLFARHDIRAIPYDGAWLPVKYPWHILPLLSHLLETELRKTTIHRSARIHKTAVIDGPVWIDEDAEVLANACIRGPAYIGKRAIVANNALVRGSSVGDDCIVGFCTEVKGSALAAHVWTHMSYLGDSVIGENVSFGAGAITGNLRLDEGEIHSHHGEVRLPTGLSKFGAVVGSDCRIGIHTGINPGCKIGEGSFISSGVIIAKDIPTRSFVLVKSGEISVRPNVHSAPKPSARNRYRNAVSQKKSVKKRRG